MLDVVLDKSHAKTRPYMSALPSERWRRRTTVARQAERRDGRLDDVKISSGRRTACRRANHYGCRIAQASDANLFVTLGEHFIYRDEAQNLANHLGKLIRISPDGSRRNNPFSAHRRGSRRNLELRPPQ